MQTIAALYIDPTGHYPTIPGVDCWDESRDARLYPGPYPVIAHPPCGPWGRFAWKCEYQDKTLAPIAVDQVRTWGGVLEHPASSGLWPYCGLPAVGAGPDAYGGFSALVYQSGWGHRIEKATKLYMVGVPWNAVVPMPRRSASTIYSSLSARERRLSPLAFAAWLVELARQVRR